MTIVVVPYRPQPWRDQLWAFLRDNYWPRTGLTPILGEHLDGPFNRAKAVNDALTGSWDVAVIADSDTWVPVDQLKRAIHQARHTGRLCSALTSVVELSETCTRAVMAGAATFLDFGVEKIRTRDLETQSSMIAIPRALWDDIGGMDERFQGWGGEDNAIWRAASILGGKPHRIPGNAYHLWHPTAKNIKDPLYRANLRLWRRYETCRHPNQLRRLCTRSESSPTH